MGQALVTYSMEARDVCEIIILLLLPINSWQAGENISEFHLATFLEVQAPYSQVIE